MSRGRRLALVAAYAAVTFLAFPQPVGGGAIDLGAGLAWWAPALLVLALHGLAPRAGLRVGFAASWLAHVAVLHWIWVVTVVYGHAPAPLGLLGPALLAVYVAAFGGLFGLGWAWLAQRGRAGPFSGAALWTALDHARSFAFTGFPWATLGTAQHGNPVLLPLASLTGVYGLSFVTVLGGVALAEGALAWRAGERPPRRVLAALGVVVLAHGVAAALPDPEAEAGRPTVRVAVLQGNIDQGVKWNRAWIDRTLEAYEELSRSAAAEGAQLVVWPETAVPGALEANAGLRGRVEDLAREIGATLVVGGVGLDFDARGRTRAYYDSAFHIDARGQLRDRYDKTHLVPFGEYVPFADLLGHFLRAVASGIASVGVTEGPAPRALELDPPGAAPLRAGVPICYELLFPDLVRRFPADGAELLLGITNDAWYGRTGAPYQFLAITALRSAETGLWTARAANTGVSAFIDGRGHVRQRTAIFERAFLVADVPLHPDPTRATPYVRFGNVFAWACWLSVLAWALAARRAAPQVRAAGE